MGTFRPTIGLEIHAELKTNTKMFCACRNDPDEKRPNINICPVCMAHPGTLPVINREAVKKVLLVGAALKGDLADYTEFDRKNYFYPDIPKGYQISQYKYPLVSGGELLGVAITRVHLEEDTARSQHEGEKSLVDFNRAGVPLMELVTEPVLKSAEAAGAFARELQLTLRYLNASEANMEKGEMRVEANISVSKDDTRGTKVEIKNLNSFRSVERAVAYEVKRQSELIEKGGEVAQETRGWDEEKQATFSQRKKESSHDYRYFPDPDLPSILLSEIPEFSKDVLLKEMPELPSQKRERYTSLEMKAEDVEAIVQDSRLQESVDDLVKRFGKNSLEFKLSVNYLTNDAVKIIRDLEEKGKTEIRFPTKNYADFIGYIVEGSRSSAVVKMVLPEMIETGKEYVEILRKKEIRDFSSEELEIIVSGVIQANPKVVSDYKAGKLSALQFLVGQGMKETKGSANPELLRKVFVEALG